MVREAPFGDVELRRRDAEVEQEAVDPVDSGLDQKLVQVAEVALEETVACARNLALEALGGGGKRHVVLVDADGQALWRHATGELDRVACPSQRAVADDLARLGVQPVQDLLEHHGYVRKCCCQFAHSTHPNINASRSLSKSSYFSCHLSAFQMAK